MNPYIVSGWVDGLVQSSVAQTEVNGMKAATATARAGEWNFLLAVIRFDQNESIDLRGTHFERGRSNAIPHIDRFIPADHA